MFLVRYHDGQGKKGIINGKFYTVIWDNGIKTKLKAQSGSIYELDNSNFSCDLYKGMGENEYTSKENAEVINEEVFKSALQSMIDNGVIVYFIDEKDKEKLNGDDHGFNFLKTIKSENDLLN